MFCSYFNSIDTLNKGKGAFKAGALGAMKTNVFHTVKILTFGLFAVYLKKGGIKPKVYVSAFILMLSFYSSYTCKEKNYVTVLFSYPCLLSFLFSMVCLILCWTIFPNFYLLYSYRFFTTFLCLIYNKREFEYSWIHWLQSNF